MLTLNIQESTAACSSKHTFICDHSIFNTHLHLAFYIQLSLTSTNITTLNNMTAYNVL